MKYENVNCCGLTLTARGADLRFVPQNASGVTNKVLYPSILDSPNPPAVKHFTSRSLASVCVDAAVWIEQPGHDENKTKPRCCPMPSLFGLCPGMIGSAAPMCICTVRTAARAGTVLLRHPRL